LAKQVFPNASHAYLEVRSGEEWRPVDATWDIGLDRVLLAGKWNGVDATAVGVPAKEVYSPEKSAEIMAILDDPAVYEKAFNEDFKINGEFYRAFNKWLEEARDLS
jgi:hypothetical protein